MWRTTLRPGRLVLGVHAERLEDLAQDLLVVLVCSRYFSHSSFSSSFSAQRTAFV